MKDTFNIFQIFKSKNHRYCFVVRPIPCSRLLSLRSFRNALAWKNDEFMVIERVFVAKDVLLVNFKRSICMTIRINGEVVRQSEEVLRIFDDKNLTIESVSPFAIKSDDDD